MKKGRLFFVLLFLFGLVFTTNEVYKYYFIPQGVPVLIENIVTFTPTPTTQSTLAPESQASVPAPVGADSVVPIEDLPINGYTVNDMVDFSSGVPIQMVLWLPNGKGIPSSWAAPYSHINADHSEDFFDPANGTTYIYQTSDFDQGFGNVPVLLAHSSSVGGVNLFAANLEYFLRIKEVGVSQYTTEETIALFNSQIIGSIVSVCQDESKRPLLQPSMDTTCQGELVSFRVVGGEVILRDDVSELEYHTLDLHHWLVDKYPNSGFDKITDETGMLYIFCLGRLSDQSNDGTDRFSENRVVMVLEAMP